MMRNIYTTIILFIFVTNFIFGLFFRLDTKIVFNSIKYKQDTSEYKIFTQIRIPRILATYFVGAGLAIVGCVLQSIFLNPLCEGYTLGISSAAGLGVVISTVFNLPLNKFFGAFYGIIISILSVYFLIIIFKRTIDISFVLSGVVLNFFFSSIIVILTLYFDPYKMHYILLWLLGSFSSLEPTYVVIVSCIILLLLIVILLHATQMDIIILGKEKSVSLGVREQRVKSILILCCIIICALCVSLAGTISFVGILVPNVVKTIAGLNHKKWFMLSIFTGAVFVSLCDNLARNLLYPIEIPINVFTGILGSIFFIVNLVKGNFYGVVKS